MPTPNNGFVIVGRQIKTEFAEDVYPVTEDVDTLGGLAVVDSLSDIQTTPQERTKIYMLRVDGSTGIIYQYVPNPAAPPNFIWAPFSNLGPSAPKVIASATGTVVPDFSNANIEYQLLGSLTISNPTTAVAGMNRTILFKQPAGGGVPVFWGAAYDTSTFTLNAAVNAYTVAKLYVDSAGVIHVRGS